MGVIHGIADGADAPTDVQKALPIRINPTSGALLTEGGATTANDLSVAVPFTATGGSTATPNVAQQVIGSNLDRNALIVQVDTIASASLFVGFGSTVGQTTENMIELRPGGSVTFSGIVPSQEVVVLSTVAGIEFVVLEA